MSRFLLRLPVRRVLLNTSLISTSRRTLSTAVLNHQSVPKPTPPAAINEKESDHHAVVSTFDLFSIGVGPSSSHTVGPMRAAKIFVASLITAGVLQRVSKVRVDLFGSLALTGKGHGTPEAILMGLEGETPESVETKSIRSRVEAMRENQSLRLNAEHRVRFNPDVDLVFNFFQSLPQHPNGMRFCVFDDKGDLVATNEYFSIGGGFVVNEATQIAHGENVYYKSFERDSAPPALKEQDLSVTTAALPFKNAAELLEVCNRNNLTIAQVVHENELRWRSASEIRERLLTIWNVMDESIRNGCLADEEEYLPGPLRIQRRAPKLYKRLVGGLGVYQVPTQSMPRISSSSTSLPIGSTGSPPANTQPQILSNSIIPSRSRKRIFLPALDYLSVYAIAVNEENATGNRVICGPTLGASGTLPAVLKYYLEFISENPEQDVIEFLLTAAAIGMLFKRGASISAAEVGCQGEVGVACSMAAGAFAAAMGGSPAIVENAAEIGMEHNLGLTCDPPHGLVQIPCIERNALAAVKAVTAAQLALNGDGTHRVTLDQCIETMRQTGHDMMGKYKETSQGGLAVNVPMC